MISRMRRRARIAVAAVTLAATATVGPAAAADAWSIVPSPNASATQHNFLFDVACLTQSDCWSAGYYTAATGSQTLIEHWDGASWSVVASPNTDVAQNNFLFGIACASSSRCWATGYYWSGESYSALILGWDGTSWSIVPSVAPSPARSDLLIAAACATPTDCWAVGSSKPGPNGGVGPNQTLTLRWNGVAWSVVSSPNTAPVDTNGLGAITCSSSSDCWAVGGSGNPSGGRPLAMRWDGSAWSIVPTPVPAGASTAGLSGVTCSSPDRCWAVGYGRGSGIDQTLALRWGGAAWTIEPTQNYSALQPNVLFDVACHSDDDCWTVGYHRPSTTIQTLIERWDGSSWSLTPSPNTSTGQTNQFFGAACPSVGTCWGVGNYYGAGSIAKTLTARFQGLEPATPPGAPGAPDVSGSSGEVSLSWTAPASDGGSAITGYRVYRGTGEALALVTSGACAGLGAVTDCTDPGLADGTEYVYTVAAVNAVGEGPQSAGTIATTPPGPPVSLTATPGDGAVVLQWSPPPDGSAPITGYRVHRGTAVEAMVPVVDTVSTTFHDGGLTNGTEYRYAVVAVNAGGTGSPSAVVSATPAVPTAPDVVIEPVAIAFGTIEVGTASAPAAFTVRNTGDAVLQLHRLSVGGTNASEFGVEQGSCGGVVEPGEECAGSVVFRPGAVGTRTADLEVWHDGPGLLVRVSLRGAGGSGLVASPASIAFPSQDAGTTSGPRRITLTSSLARDVAMAPVVLSGDDAFAITSDGCSGVVLPPAGSCDVDVVAAPDGGGSSRATLAFPNDATAVAPQVALSAYAVAPTIVVEPAALSFGAHALGTTSPVSAVTLRNAGGAVLRLEAFAFAGEDAQDFRLAWDGCGGTTVEPGNACQVQIAFAPSTAGARSASLRAPWNGGVTSIPLGGTGVIDTAPPRSIISTQPDTVFLPVYGSMTGRTTEDLTGVASVGVTFSGPSGVTARDATLECDTARSACRWYVSPPVTPGIYSATVRGTDGAGNVEDPGPSIRIVVI